MEWVGRVDGLVKSWLFRWISERLGEWQDSVYGGVGKWVDGGS